jgi:tetratricopeptide (TPR) repeat protein
MKLKYGLTLLLIGLIAMPILAQENYKKEHKKKYKMADILLDLEDYQGALTIYEDLYPLDTSYADIYYKMGACNFHTQDSRGKAKALFQQARNLGSKEAYFYLAQISHLEHAFDDALKLYRYYKVMGGEKQSNEAVDWHIGVSQNAQEYVSNPIEVSISNAGKNINTEHHEYVPLVTADGSYMFFTSRRPGSTGGLQDPTGEYFEDIYSTHKEGGQWVTASNMGGTVNTATHDATVGMSANGNALIIYQTNVNLTGGDLFISELGSIDNWMTPQKLGSNINTEYQEPSACLSTDETLMYFSSNRPDGYGGKDLYVVRKLPTGEWGTALNLGPNINTARDEDAPFLTADGKVLYFSSKGHTNIGGYDIFRVEKDENGVWTLVENLGYPLNSVEDDIYFSCSADGKTGYYSSDQQGGFGGQDIYVVDMVFDHPKPTIVRGVVEDGTGKPLKAKITLVDEETKKIHGIYNSNASNGKFLLIVDPDTRYQMVVEAEGFHSSVDYMVYQVEEALEEKKTKVVLKEDTIDD